MDLTNLGYFVQGIVIFLFGGLYEAGCVGFIHYSERGEPFKTALCSMGAAAVEIAGILGSVHDWRLAPFFVAGYGTGSYFAVAWKSHWKSKK